MRPKNPGFFLGGGGGATGSDGGIGTTAVVGGEAGDAAGSNSVGGGTLANEGIGTLRWPGCSGCRWQKSPGWVPWRKYSVFACGHRGVASSPVSGSIWTCTTPEGIEGSTVRLYSGTWMARFMNSVQMGSAESAPCRFNSRSVS